MFERASEIRFSVRRKPLVACLALTLGLALDQAVAGLSPNNDTRRPGYQLHTEDDAVPKTMTYFVDTCADDNSSHSLRTLVGLAASGDTIDLSQLPMACSTITIDHTQIPPYIAVNQYSLNFVGDSNRTIVLDGDNYQASLIRHFGTGKLSVSHLTLPMASISVTTRQKADASIPRGM
jgi:hypothetical protein